MSGGETNIRTIHEIVSQFGLPHASAHKGKGWQYRGAVDLCNKVEVWWPKMSPFDPASGWRNIPQLNAIGNVVKITERYVKKASVNDAHVNEILTRRQTRLVFGKFLNQPGYTYIGRFELDVGATQSQNVCVWTLAHTPIDFDQDRKWAEQEANREAR